MEGLVILGLIVGGIAALLWRARGKVGLGTSVDIAAQRDIPPRPIGGDEGHVGGFNSGFGSGGVGGGSN